MKDITKNEMNFVLTILKTPETEFNANNISKHLKISPMGSLKIAKKLESENILTSKKLGKTKFYKINHENDYTKQYIKFLLKREAEQAPPYIKRWINELKKIKNTDAIILFGSILKKQKEAQDIDTLLITNQKKFQNLKEEIEQINLINDKNIHPIYQTKQDLKENIKKQDKTILNAIKGITTYGEDTIIKMLEK